MKTIIRATYLSLALGLVITTSPSAFATENTKANTVTDDGDTVAMPLRDIQRFATAVAQIKRFYIKPIDDTTLFNYAIAGMLSNLDPHSSFLDPDTLKDLQSATTGEFGGVGIEVIPDQGLIKVVSPIDGTPAAEAGIKPGDMIYRVGDKFVKDLTLREAINLIRGKIGTKVDLSVVRKGEKKPLKFELTRANIKIDTVKSKVYDDQYGYLRISLFQGNTKKDLDTAIAKLKKESHNKLRGVVLDLRNNPGGLLDSSIEIADTFLDLQKLSKHDKLIVYTKGRIPGTDVQAKATRGDKLSGIPMVVLINEGSASASEIVAGALQDHARAIVVGAKSFGKGSVQTVLPIDYESGIKLTTALYYTPAGNSIQATGIKPDVLIADLKIPKSSTDDLVLETIGEADLENHLANGNGKDEKAVEKADEEKTKSGMELARSDYQLYEALNILKGLSALNN